MPQPLKLLQNQIQINYRSNSFKMLSKLLRDAQRIVKWRSFYLKTLHPLDVEAVKLIKENTHLYYQVSKPGRNNYVTFTF